MDWVKGKRQSLVVDEGVPLQHRSLLVFSFCLPPICWLQDSRLLWGPCTSRPSAISWNLLAQSLFPSVCMLAAGLKAAVGPMYEQANAISGKLESVRPMPHWQSHLNACTFQFC